MIPLNSPLKLMAPIYCMIFLTACDPSENDEKTVAKAFNIETVALKYDVNCHTSSCNPSLAAVFTEVSKDTTSYGSYELTNIGYQMCTSWKVGTFENKTLMLTNRHCIENLLAEHRNKCNDKMIFRFLGNSLMDLIPVSAKCSKIMETSDILLNAGVNDFKLVKDYALIQLDRNVDRPVIDIKQETITDGLDVNVQSLDFNKDQYTVRFKSQQCKIVKNSIVNHFSFDDNGPILLLHGCHIISGNSGSVVFNNQKSAIGLTYGSGSSGEEKSPLSLELDKPKSPFDSENLSFVLNFDCVDLPHLGLRSAKDCSSEVDESKIKVIERTQKKAIHYEKLMVSDLLDNSVREWTGKNSDIFQWKFVAKKIKGNEGSRKFTLAPKCIIPPNHNSSNWIKDYRLSDVNGHRNLQQVTFLEFSAPQYKVDSSFNSVGQQQFEKSVEYKDLYFQISPANLSRGLTPKIYSVSKYSPSNTFYTRFDRQSENPFDFEILDSIDDKSNVENSDLQKQPALDRIKKYYNKILLDIFYCDMDE